jgi:spermidine synthase
MRKATFLPEIFLIALAAIVLEISFTRIFSFRLYYYFTYLIIGIAMLGLGSGGILATVLRPLRNGRAELLVPRCAMAAALLVPVTYFVVAVTQINAIDFVDEPMAIVRLLTVCGLLFAPFLAIGLALAVLFGSFPQQINKLYFADLLGAGLGCALCVPIFTLLSPAAAVMFAGALLATAAAITRPPAGSKLRLYAGALALVLSAATLGHTWLPEPVADRTKTLSPQLLGPRPLLFSSWSSLFRVDVLSLPGANNNESYLIAHDGHAGSGIHAFDGDATQLTRFDSDIRSEPFSVLKKQPEVLIIGAAGGHEILASLHFDAAHVTAVELNPVTVSLLRDHFADYTGRIAYDPRVTLVNAEGRSFIQRTEKRFDLIWFVAPDSYSAMNAASSGAFVLSESYLFTVEMIRDSLSRLSEDGIICVQWGELFNERKRAARYINTANAALKELGVADPSDHILVSTRQSHVPTSTIIVGREAITEQREEAFGKAVANIPKATLWHPRGSVVDGAGGGTEHPIYRALGSAGSAKEEWLEQAPYEFGAVTDDSPFFWHFTRFRDALSRPWRASKDLQAYELATGEQTLLILLALVTVFAGACLLLPLIFLREVWSELPQKRFAATYFAGLGLGFMFFEVCLIQKLTLFLGYPTYSLTVTLFSILISSGIGSLLSARYRAALGPKRALWVLLTAIGLLTLFYLFAMAGLEVWFARSAFPIRVVMAVALLAPLGLCLGAFMPLGLSSIAQKTSHEREYVAWAWAVNGFFSVVSSVLSTILAMSLGFNAVLGLGFTMYAVAVIAMTSSNLLDADEA